MAESLTKYIHRKKTEHELFTARRILAHLVEIHDSGQWRWIYREKAFIGAVRKAREAVDYWTSVIGRHGDGASQTTKKLSKKTKV